MRSKNVKKMLAVTLATTMLMASAMTVCAADGSGGSTSESTSSSTTSSPQTEDDNTPSVTLQDVVTANVQVTVGGKSVLTTVAGYYAAKSVDGIAITTPLADVKANLGLKDNQSPYIMVFDLDVKKSNLAMNSLNAAAEAYGVDIITSLNVDLVAKQNGKLVTLSDGTINMVVGIPKTAIDAEKTYSVICVRPGGAISTLEDVDTNPDTVTFAVNAGLGAYAIVMK